MLKMEWDEKGECSSGDEFKMEWEEEGKCWWYVSDEGVAAS